MRLDIQYLDYGNFWLLLCQQLLIWRAQYKPSDREEWFKFNLASEDSVTGHLVPLLQAYGETEYHSGKCIGKEAV